MPTPHFPRCLLRRLVIGRELLRVLTPWPRRCRRARPTAFPPTGLPLSGVGPYVPGVFLVRGTRLAAILFLETSEKPRNSRWIDDTDWIRCAVLADHVAVAANS